MRTLSNLAVFAVFFLFDATIQFKSNILEALHWHLYGKSNLNPVLEYNNT
ncbi:MAG: hypothetical protein ACOYOA_09205 [Saprospiraceae bacterium]